MSHIELADRLDSLERLVEQLAAKLMRLSQDHADELFKLERDARDLEQRVWELERRPR